MNAAGKRLDLPGHLQPGERLLHQIGELLVVDRR